MRENRGKGTEPNMNETTNQLAFCLYCMDAFADGETAKQHAQAAHQVEDPLAIAGSWCDSIIGRADLEDFERQLWLFAHHDALGGIFNDWMRRDPETNAQALKYLLTAANRARWTVGEPLTAQDADQDPAATSADSTGGLK